MNEPEYVLEHKTHEIFLDFQIQMGHPWQAEEHT